MKIKWNWGTGLFLFILLFLGCMITFVLYSMKFDRNLVYEDYYPREQQYEEMIQKKRNLKNSGYYIKSKKKEGKLILTFPSDSTLSTVSGNIHFYRPSSDRLDQFAEIQINDNGEQFFDLQSFEKGKYLIKIDWIYGQTALYQEIPVLFN